MDGWEARGHGKSIDHLRFQPKAYFVLNIVFPGRIYTRDIGICYLFLGFLRKTDYTNCKRCYRILKPFYVSFSFSHARLMSRLEYSAKIT